MALCGGSWGRIPCSPPNSLPGWPQDSVGVFGGEESLAERARACLYCHCPHGGLLGKATALSTSFLQKTPHTWWLIMDSCHTSPPSDILTA